MSLLVVDGVDNGGQRLLNVAAPTSGSDGANKDYVDTVAVAPVPLVLAGATYTVPTNTQVGYFRTIAVGAGGSLVVKGTLYSTK